MLNKFKKVTREAMATNVYIIDFDINFMDLSNKKIEMPPSIIFIKVA